MDIGVPQEPLILSNLLFNRDYSAKVSPYMQPDFFEDRAVRIAYEVFDEHVKKYSSLPSLESMVIDTEKRTDITDDEFTEVRELIGFAHKTYQSSDSVDPEWLLEMSETHCRNMAITNALIESAAIADGTTSLLPTAIPELLSNALAVSFDHSIGHNYLKDANDRFESYHSVEARLPCDIEMFNHITKGGFPRKTLNVFMGTTGGFKSGTLCHLAASYLTKGQNVLYITMELAEEEVSKRIDANLMNITIDKLMLLGKQEFMGRVGELQEKMSGDLFIKQFPTGEANTGHFDQLVNELKIKSGFIPDIIIIDYINICSSTRVKADSNSYTYVKMIAEEMRGFFVRHNVVGFTATQSNRSASGGSDVALNQTSESWGLPATADFFLGIVITDEMAQVDQAMFKQLKNRYSDETQCQKFMLGINKAKMQLFDIEQSAAIGLSNEVEAGRPRTKTFTRDSKDESSVGMNSGWKKKRGRSGGMDGFVI